MKTYETTLWTGEAPPPAPDGHDDLILRADELDIRVGGQHGVVVGPIDPGAIEVVRWGPPVEITWQERPGCVVRAWHSGGRIAWHDPDEPRVAKRHPPSAAENLPAAL